jgi:hypothetical protein
MKVPRGSLVRRRVINNPGTVLETALEAGLTGYARLESQDALLLDGEGVGVLTFLDGIPTAAYHTGSERGGPPALADLAVDGPYRLELFELDEGALTEVHDASDLRVPPGMPAERLAGAPSLADRTRTVAPDDRAGDAPADPERNPGAVEAFLEDEETITAIREQARAEARERAAEWDL